MLSGFEDDEAVIRVGYELDSDQDEVRFHFRSKSVRVLKAIRDGAQRRIDELEEGRDGTESG